MIDAISPQPLTPPSGKAVKDPAAMAAAQAFEATFVAEMLKYSGINKTSESFGGGPGEDAFSSMLTQAYADEITAAGGIGLAEHIYKTIVAQE